MNMKKRCWVIKGRYNYHFLWNVYLHSAHCVCTVLTAAGCEWLKWKAKFKSIFWLKLSFFFIWKFQISNLISFFQRFLPTLFSDSFEVLGMPGRYDICMNAMTRLWEAITYLTADVYSFLDICLYICVCAQQRWNYLASFKREGGPERKRRKKFEDLDVQADGARVWDMVSWVVKFPKEECIYTK